MTILDFTEWRRKLDPLASGTLRLDPVSPGPIECAAACPRQARVVIGLPKQALTRRIGAPSAVESQGEEG